jgi:hypothetical protein
MEVLMPTVGQVPIDVELESLCGRYYQATRDR